MFGTFFNHVHKHYLYEHIPEYLQEDTGPHRSPGNQFHLIDTFVQTYDHIITLILEEKNSDSIEEDLNFVCEFSLFLHYLPKELFLLNKLEFTSHKHALPEISLKLTQWF